MLQIFNKLFKKQKILNTLVELCHSCKNCKYTDEDHKDQYYCTELKEELNCCICNENFYIKEAPLKNYKIIYTVSTSGSKDFTNEQKEELKKLGFTFRRSGSWAKEYYFNENKVNDHMILKICPDEGYMKIRIDLHTYSSYFYPMPSDLEKYTKPFYKKIMSMISEDINTLESIEVIK